MALKLHARTAVSSFRVQTRGKSKGAGVTRVKAKAGGSRSVGRSVRSSRRRAATRRPAARKPLARKTIRPRALHPSPGKLAHKRPKRPEPAHAKTTPAKGHEAVIEEAHVPILDDEEIDEERQAPEPRPVPAATDDNPRHRVGDFVVYPGVGVCEVTQIESRRFGEFERRFYFLRVLSDRARILLPVANAPRVGLRGIISSKEATAVYSVLKNQVNRRIKDWKKRQALITEKVASGDPLKAAEVYKRLFFLSKTKGLSHGENVAFVKVRTILADELSIISKTNKDAMIAKIDKILEASYKKRGGMEADEEEE